MSKLIENGSAVIAMTGVALTVVSGLSRLLGIYYLANIQVMTVFSAGMGLMLIGIVGKLFACKQTS